MTATKSKLVYQFKVLRGRHVESDEENGRQKIHRIGDIIETESDLRRFNTSRDIKFELLNEMEVKPVLPKPGRV